MVKVSEIFISRQGEGFLMGERCLFIRVADCNLTKHCGIFCDTGKLVGIDVDIDVLVKNIKEIINENDIRNIVITGGEPILYINELFELINKLDKDVLWQIESNGTIPLDLENTLKCVDKNKVKFVISPKNGVKFDESYYGLYKATAKFGEPCVVFKFVVQAGDNIFRNSTNMPFFNEIEIYKVVKMLIDNGISKNDIWLMPFARNEDELESIATAIYVIARLLDVNYSDRLHIRFNFK